MSKKKKKKGATRYGISAEDFVTAWSTSSTIADVMQKLKMPKNAVYSRVNSYRSKGIKLKSMRRPQKVLDIENLNKIAQSAQKGK